MIMPPARRVTLESEPGPPVVWTVTVDGKVRYHGPSQPMAHRAYRWAAWCSHRERRTVPTPGC